MVTRVARGHQAVHPTPKMPAQALHDGKTAGDIFMLGGTLLYAATGHPPFYSTSVRRSSGPPRCSLTFPACPDGLVPVVERCLRRTGKPADAERLAQNSAAGTA